MIPAVTGSGRCHPHCHSFPLGPRLSATVRSLLGTPESLHARHSEGLRLDCEPNLGTVMGVSHTCRCPGGHRAAEERVGILGQTPGRALGAVQMSTW